MTYELDDCHRARLEQAARVIETMDARFDMSEWFRTNDYRELMNPDALHDCGTSCCIGGTMEALWKKSSERSLGEATIGELIGIDEVGTEALFYPPDHDARGRKLLECANAAVGAAVVRYLAATGEVDWPGVADAYYAEHPLAPFYRGDR